MPIIEKKLESVKKSIMKGGKKPHNVTTQRHTETINIMACFLGEFFQAYFLSLACPASEMPFSFHSPVLLPTKENPCRDPN